METRMRLTVFAIFFFDHILADWGAAAFLDDDGA